MGTPMIVPVTTQLKDELAATGRVLAALDKEASQSGRNNVINDKGHYVQVVDTLEPLVLAALSATSTMALTKMAAQTGARFDMGAGSSLAHQVTASVTYLRGTASQLLALNDFSQYKTGHVDVALGYLRDLNVKFLSAIRYQAVVDLEVVKAKGATELIDAADHLAKLAAAKAPEDSKVWTHQGLVAKLEAREDQGVKATAATAYRPSTGRDFPDGRK